MKVVIRGMPFLDILPQENAEKESPTIFGKRASEQRRIRIKGIEEPHWFFGF